MKSAEEWINDECTPPSCNYQISMRSHLCTHESEHTDEDLLVWIKQIQLDAFKAGMTRAIHICNDNFADYDTDRDGRIIGKAILTDRDNLKELP